MTQDKEQNATPLTHGLQPVPLSRAATVTKRKTGAPVGNKNAQRIGAKVKAVIAALVADPELTIAKACLAAGCPERTYYKAQHSEAFAAHLRSLARGRLRTDMVVSALHRFNKLVQAESEYVAADVTKDILAQAGVRDRVDGSARPAGAGSISIVINGRPGEQVRIEAQDVVHDGTAQRLEDEQKS